MENEHQTSSTSSNAASPNGRQSTPSLPVYSGIPDRQAVQVIQQALHRQPSTAAQYLQQMYAAQQQHLMLQTAALQQQQHLSSAQLQSLAAVQQAGLAASRQGTPPVTNVCQQNLSQPQTQINLTTSPQIISRTQSGSSTPASASGVTQQAVLVGNATSPALSASQAQMYLRAQMLIFTPTATVTSVQSEINAGSSSQTPICSSQVQNLAMRGKHVTTAGALSTQSHLPSLAMKPPSSNISLQTVSSSAHTKPAGHVLLPAVRGGPGDTSDTHKKMESQTADTRGMTNHRPLVPVTAHSIISPAYTHQLMQQKQIQHQFVIQQQIQPRPVLPVAQISSPLQPLNHQPQVGQCVSAPPVTSQAPPNPISTCVETGGQRPSSAVQMPAAQACAGLSGRILQEGHKSTLHCQPLSQNSAVILHIQAPTGATPPPPDDTTKHNTLPPKNVSVNPSLIHVSRDLPSPSQPTVGITETSEQSRSLPNDVGQPAFPDPNPHPALDMTSGTGSSTVPAAATGSAPHNGENKPPQAVVRPQILTHVIEGFVIQEGAQPFPSHRSRAVTEAGVCSSRKSVLTAASLLRQVGRSSLLVGARETYKSLPSEKNPQQDNTTTTTDSEMEESFAQETKDDGPTLQCELCGLVDFEYKFKGTKRFCSMACAKRYNVGCTKRVGLFHPDRSKVQKGPKHTRRKQRKGSLRNLNTESKKQLPVSITPLNTIPLSVSSALKDVNSQEDSSRASDNSSYEEPLSPISASSSLSQRQPSERDLELPGLHSGDHLPLNQNFLPSNPTQWKVEDVYEFIRSLPGCQEISEEFRAQEIDGQALLLLREEHLMSAMNIKLGPALKIYARISTLKDS
ncbi:polyhomeotic 2 isoform X1 [Pelobates cultripes]|uniref:Polyhomeotic 2 isoform X1 n=1 Tax=Pelobates cultripes TaxID=61616 RepID=A0AAD1WMS4_PELCU|nr:polyhomeotic 2 isoform X1 [Pelobates cultripes]